VLIDGNPHRTEFFYCTTGIETRNHSEAVVTGGNLIKNCDLGLRVNDTSSALVRNTTFDDCNLYAVDAGWQSEPDLGDVTGWGPGMNTFTGNCGSRYKHVNAPFRDPAVGPVMAEMNWWGSDPPDSSCFSSGTVDYNPWLHSDPNDAGIEEIVEHTLDEIPPRIEQNYPNPFRDETKIRYSVPMPGTRVVIRVFDVKGRLVRWLVDRSHDMGTHRIRWDGMDDNGRRVASGIYFCRIKIGDAFTETKKMILGR
jgi:hypothetical protein